MKRNQKIASAIAAALSAHAATAYGAEPSTGEAVPASSGLQEVVVTAQRRSESIQDVPITIQALTGGQLAQMSITTFDDVIKILPNVTFSANGPGQGNIYIRGLSVGFAGSQSSASINPYPNVATYLDEQSLTFPARNVDVYMVLDLQGYDPDLNNPRYPGCLLQMSAQDFRALGDKYLTDTRIYRTGKPRFIDKMPNNFRHGVCGTFTRGSACPRPAAGPHAQRSVERRFPIPLVPPDGHRHGSGARRTHLLHRRARLRDLGNQRVPARALRCAVRGGPCACGWRFRITDPNAWTGKRHKRCGQKLKLNFVSED